MTRLEKFAVVFAAVSWLTVVIVYGLDAASSPTQFTLHAGLVK